MLVHDGIISAINWMRIDGGVSKLSSTHRHRPANAYYDLNQRTELVVYSCYRLINDPKVNLRSIENGSKVHFAAESEHHYKRTFLT